MSSGVSQPKHLQICAYSLYAWSSINNAIDL